MLIKCLNCGRPYPDKGAPYVCPSCGGLYDFAEPLTLGDVSAIAPGIWGNLIALGVNTPPLSLGEGLTPLLPVKIGKREVWLKCEYANPTGSFKDRGSAALVSFLLMRGITEAVEDSSGNAGASFAAYAARAGIKAKVFVPETASGPKRQQIEMYGAELVAVPGPRSNATDAVRRAAQAGVTYASHASMPFNLPGYATCALEVIEQLGRAPGAVVVPAGQGGLLLGMARGFEALRNAGRISSRPVVIGVQAAACAPLTALFDMGMMGMSFVTEGETVAEGVRCRSPLRAQAVIDAVQQSAGRFVAIDEAAILPARDALARLGFYVEPTSALAWQALQEAIAVLPDPVIAVLTGSGYKTR